MLRNSIVLLFTRQNYDQSSALAVYEEFHSRLLFRTEFRFIFFSAQGRSTWSDDISSLSRIGILIGKAEYYFQDLPSDSKATGYGRVEEVGLTADFAGYDAIFRQSLIPRKTHSRLPPPGY